MTVFGRNGLFGFTLREASAAHSASNGSPGLGREGAGFSLTLLPLVAESPFVDVQDEPTAACLKGGVEAGPKEAERN